MPNRKLQEATIALVDKIIWQIEMRLDQPLTAADLADACAVSRFHMSRVFRAATGLSPMTYLRARRLGNAAARIAAGEDILSVALDAQYASHEAFTRAFTACFGVLPSTVRKQGSTQSLNLMEPIEMKRDLLVPVASPEIRDQTAFRVAGLALSCSVEDIGGIPALWGAFNQREDELTLTVPNTAFGVCCDADESGRFRYIAGGAVAPGDLPRGMEAVDVPAGRYAVFTHSGHIADMPKTVYTIWNQSLTDEGLTHRPAPDFELYDKRFNPETGRGEVEIWIPVE